MNMPEKSISKSRKGGDGQRRTTVPGFTETDSIPSTCCALGWKAGRGQMWPPPLGRAQVGGRDRLRGKGHPLVLALGWKAAEHPGWRARGRCLEPAQGEEGRTRRDRSLCKGPGVRNGHVTHPRAAWGQALREAPRSRTEGEETRRAPRSRCAEDVPARRPKTHGAHRGIEQNAGGSPAAAAVTDCHIRSGARQHTLIL